MWNDSLSLLFFFLPTKKTRQDERSTTLGRNTIVMHDYILHKWDEMGFSLTYIQRKCTIDLWNISINDG